jgi:hypothetical protein
VLIEQGSRPLPHQSESDELKPLNLRGSLHRRSLLLSVERSKLGASGLPVP